MLYFGMMLILFVLVFVVVKGKKSSKALVVGIGSILIASKVLRVNKSSYYLKKWNDKKLASVDNKSGRIRFIKSFL